MRDTDEAARAVLVLVVGDRATMLGTIDRTTRCDLGLIERILRLRLAATRLGWSVQLTQPDNDLAELIELVGLSDCLLG